MKLKSWFKPTYSSCCWRGFHCEKMEKFPIIWNATVCCRSQQIWHVVWMGLSNRRILTDWPQNEWAGRERWSSGSGRRLMFQRSWVWLSAPYTGWTFFTFICCKYCNVSLKRPKIKQKRGWPIFLLKTIILTDWPENELKRMQTYSVGTEAYVWKGWKYVADELEIEIECDTLTMKLRKVEKGRMREREWEKENDDKIMNSTTTT